MRGVLRGSGQMSGGVLQAAGSEWLLGRTGGLAAEARPHPAAMRARLAAAVTFWPMWR